MAVSERHRLVSFMDNVLFTFQSSIQLERDQFEEDDLRRLSRRVREISDYLDSLADSKASRKAAKKH